MIKTKQEIMYILQQTSVSKSQITFLDRAKSAERKKLLGTFLTEVEKGIGGFQDSDVILLAITVDHKKK